MMNAEHEQLLSRLVRQPIADLLSSLSSVAHVRHDDKTSLLWTVRGADTKPSLFEPMMFAGKKTIFLLHVHIDLHLAAKMRGLHALFENPSDASRFAPSDVDQCAAIGTSHENTMFVSPNDTWVFWHSSQTLCRLTIPFEAWFEKWQLREGHAKLDGAMQAVVGTWEPVSSPTLSERVVAAMGRLSVMPDGAWRMYRSSGDGYRDFSWRADPGSDDRLVVATHHGPMIYRVVEVSPDSLTLEGPNSTSTVKYRRASEA